jgi:hypothetical protein
MRGSYFAYSLFDASGTAVYIGVGRDGAWDDLYQQRESARESELSRWLLSLDERPTAKRLISFAVPLRAANAFASSERQRLLRAGVRLLSSKAEDRPLNTYVPGGASRAVRSPRGIVYKSVRAAAVAEGVSSTAIIGWCKTARCGWRYADASPSGSEVPEDFDLIR